MLNSILRADLYRYTGRIDFKGVLRVWKSPGFRFTFFFRKVTMSKKYSLVWFFSMFFYRRYYIKYGIQIPTSVKIGKGLLLPHFGGIVINSGSEIGKNCNILQGVTLGNTKRGKNEGSPKVGNRVYIGPGAVIVGGITIGNNVLIVGNSFVNFDVPSNSIVIGNPANIIERESATEEYINRCLE